MFSHDALYWNKGLFLWTEGPGAETEGHHLRVSVDSCIMALIWRCARSLACARISSKSPHVQVVSARYALFWNKGLVPRTRAPGAETKGRRRQTSVAQDRLLAVCIICVFR